MKTQFFSAQVYDVYIGEQPPIDIIPQKSSKGCSSSLVIGFIIGGIAGAMIYHRYMNIYKPIKIDSDRYKQ